jgi:hypothetical protein
MVLNYVPFSFLSVSLGTVAHVTVDKLQKENKRHLSVQAKWCLEDYCALEPPPRV